MTDTVKFEGRILRMERGGFGIVEFDAPVGKHANTHGVFSRMATAIPFADLATGVHVTGKAEADERDLAAITELQVGQDS